MSYYNKRNHEKCKVGFITYQDKMSIRNEELILSAKEQE